jgi:hypothetical protein
MSRPTIGDFIAARLDERENILRAALAAATQNTSTHGPITKWHRPDDDMGQPSDFELHFEPEALLQDLNADRALLNLHAARGGLPGELHCGETGDWYEPGCPTLRVMAARDADHPDYDPAWRLT